MDWYSGVTPTILVEVLFFPQTICLVVVDSGATPVMKEPEKDLCNSLASSRVRVCALPRPREIRVSLDSPGRTNNKLVPKDSIRDVIVCCTPSPIAINDITADTPITIPSKVKADLNLLVLSDINAILRFTDKFKFDHPRQNQVYSFSNLSDFEHGYHLLLDHLSLI